MEKIGELVALGEKLEPVVSVIWADDILSDVADVSVGLLFLENVVVQFTHGLREMSQTQTQNEEGKANETQRHVKNMCKVTDEG